MNHKSIVLLNINIFKDVHVSLPPKVVFYNSVGLNNRKPYIRHKLYSVNFSLRKIFILGGNMRLRCLFVYRGTAVKEYKMKEL